MRVLIAIDQTAYWKQVIDALTKREWPAETSFKILTVVEPMHWEDLDKAMWKNVVLEVSEKRRHAAEEILRQARAILSSEVSHGVVHTELRSGKAHDEILNAASVWMPDKIVLGAHMHSDNRLFPGSVRRSVAQKFTVLARVGSASPDSRRR